MNALLFTYVVNRSGLERQETHWELIDGPESKNKNRRGMFGTRSDR